MTALNDDPDFIIDDKAPAASASQGRAGQGPSGERRPSADQAREILRRQISDIMDEVLIWHAGLIDAVRKAPPHKAIKITTGVGKSELLRRAAALQFVPDAKRRGLPHRVLVLVPTHRLANEARQRMPDGATVAIWQGRSAIQLETGEPMCGNPEAVEAALKIGANVEETACKNKTARCKLYEICHYQQQKAAARTADIVYCAHEALFQLPEAIGKGFGLAIVDESFWQDGLTTTSRIAIASLADELKGFPVRGYNGPKLDNETMNLRDLIQRLQTGLAEMPDGYVTRQPLIDAGLMHGQLLDDSSCTTAGRLEWKRKVDTKLQPGADDEERKKAVEKFGFLGQLPRRHQMWRVLDGLIAGDEEATGRLKIETIKTKDGPVRYLRLLNCKEIKAKLLDLPMIIADATLPLEIVKHFLPNLEVACDLKVEAPHMRITQVIGLPVGKASLQPLPPGKRSADKEERVGRKRQRLADACRHQVAGRRGLVITYKSVEVDFADIEGLEVGHFNAIEGIDRWRGVEMLVTIGRPLPQPEQIQDMAAALTGKPVVAGDTIEERRPAGPGRFLGCRVYREPSVEIIRQAITEAAIEQAVGRARGVNRTAANPVEVLMVLHDTVVPGLDVDEVVEFGDLEPDAIDHMIARGLVLQFPADAAKLHPDLFPTREAAKKAYQRDRLRAGSGPRGPRLGTWPYKDIFIRRCPQPPRVAFFFQPAGRGQLPRSCIADLVKVPDVRAVLEAALGPLVRFEEVSQAEGE